MSGIGAGEVQQRLRAFLRELVDPGVDFAAPPTPLSGGAFSANYVFELAHAPQEWSGRLVLRLVTGSGFQIRMEAGLQDGARAAGVPAPRVVHVESSGDVLGEPFMVMQLVSGRGFLGGIEWYRFARDFPKMIRSWPETFADAMTMLCRADIAAVYGALGRHGITPDQALTTRHLRWVQRTLDDTPPWDEAVQWLRQHQPPLPERLVLVHGDLWPANVLMRGRTICGFVDWTMGAVGDPGLDVGFAKVGLALLPEPFPPPPPIRTVVHHYGRRLAQEIHERCSRHVDGDTRIAYFEALRCTLQVAAVVADRRAGRQNGWEHGVPALVSHFNAITGLHVVANDAADPRRRPAR